MTRAIIHLDLDAFYASVEQLRRPELRGRPVIVGGDGGHKRSVVSAASYEARPFGVRSAMPIAQALRLCPQAVVVPVDFVAYRAASAEVTSIAQDYTPVIEPLSLDEAYLDVTASVARFGSAATIAGTIRDRIFEQTHLHASFGIATCKIVAKVASDLRKPRGFVEVPLGEEAAFLAPLPLRTLPGLGPASEEALVGLGITTIGQLAALPREVLERRIGRHAGFSLWEHARGVDRSEVTIPGPPKSISREETFTDDIDDVARIESRLRALAADVVQRLRRGAWNATTVVLKLRYADFSTVTRQCPVNAHVATERSVIASALTLFNASWDRRPVRLLGVGVTGIGDVAQLDLFDVTNKRDEKLDNVLDSLRSRFGHSAVHRGTEQSGLRDLDFRGDDLRDLSGEKPQPK